MIKLKTTLVAAAVGMSLTLTACNDDSTNYDFTGTAIDGYLRGAQITAECDVNGTTQSINAESPTNDNGVAGFFVPAGIESSDCALVVTSTNDTIDMDTGEKPGDLYLTAPKGFTIANPFTTYVSLKLKAEGIDTPTEDDINSAFEELAGELNASQTTATFTADDLTGDFFKSSNDPEARKKIVLANVFAQVLPTKAQVDNDETEADVVSIATKVTAAMGKAQTVIDDNAEGLADLFVKLVIEDGSVVGATPEEVNRPAPSDGGTGSGSGSTPANGLGS